VIGFLLAGALLGLSGGLSPGPLLALVLNETLRYGVRGGIRVALAPLVTDVPIILVTMGLLWPLTNRSLPLAVINIGGGGYLVWLGIEGLRFRGAQRTLVTRANSLRRGVIANFLNPSPYLFWLAIGAPTVLDAWRYGWSAVAAFIVAFYVLLVGSKILLAVGVGYAGVALHSRGYILLMRGLGLLLVGYGGLRLGEGGSSLYRLAGLEF
jgi:threonine/homoserine/homoserine lactone efflux protein